MQQLLGGKDRMLEYGASPGVLLYFASGSKPPKLPVTGPSGRVYGTVLRQFGGPIEAFGFDETGKPHSGKHEVTLFVLAP